MSIKSRPISTNNQLPTTPVEAGGDVGPKTAPTNTVVSPPSAKNPRRCSTSQALQITANLANLLPTGTLLAFQLLTPIFTRSGLCDSTTRHAATLVLLALLSASCFAACFTDSLRLNGQVYYGFATHRGLWLFDYDQGTGSALPDLIKYRLRAMDLVHGLLSVLVFGAVAMRDTNVVGCFYPAPGREVKEVLDLVPFGIGVLCGLLFVAFPTTRHGIGFPVTQASDHHGDK